MCQNAKWVRLAKLANSTADLFSIERDLSAPNPTVDWPIGQLKHDLKFVSDAKATT
jgi:hypothetical protein